MGQLFQAAQRGQADERVVGQVQHLQRIEPTQGRQIAHAVVCQQQLPKAGEALDPRQVDDLAVGGIQMLQSHQVRRSQLPSWPYQGLPHRGFETAIREQRAIDGAFPRC